MSEKGKNDLFYVCSLIEFVGRKTKNRRAVIVKNFGKEEIKRQLEIAELNHCLSFDEVADELIDYFHIPEGDYDTVGSCKYEVPGFLAIGKVYQRLITAVYEKGGQLEEIICQIFSSFISDEISDFNTSVYYSSPEYIKASYEEGRLLD